MVAASGVVGVVVHGDGHFVQRHAAPPVVEAVGGPFEELAAFFVAAIVRIEPTERAGDLRFVGTQFADLVQGGEGIVEQAAVAEVRVLFQSLAGFAVKNQGQTSVGFEVVRHGGDDAIEGFAGFGPLALLQQVLPSGQRLLYYFLREVLGQAMFLQVFLDHSCHLLF